MSMIIKDQISRYQQKSSNSLMPQQRHLLVDLIQRLSFLRQLRQRSSKRRNTMVSSNLKTQSRALALSMIRLFNHKKTWMLVAWCLAWCSLASSLVSCTICSNRAAIKKTRWILTPEILTVVASIGLPSSKKIMRFHKSNLVAWRIIIDFNKLYLSK